MLKFLSKQRKIMTSKPRLRVNVLRISLLRNDKKHILKNVKKWRDNIKLLIETSKTNNNLKMPFRKNLVNLFVPGIMLLLGVAFFFIFLDKSSLFSLPFYEEIDGTTKNSLPSFDDVCGNHEIKEDLQDLMFYLHNPDLFKQVGVTAPKGVMISGSAGCGKTMLAKALAGEAKVPFLYCSGSSFDQMLVGLGAKRMRQLFKRARKLAPCVIFIDEIDSIGEKRLFGGVDRSTINQLLAELDGFSELSGVVLVAATNMPDKLEPALLRSGRFDRHVKVHMPDKLTREDLFKTYLKETTVSQEVSPSDLASETAGFSGADVANIVNTAATEAAKKGASALSRDGLRAAISIIAMGRARNSLDLSEPLKRLTACHEAGHTVAALFGAAPEEVAQVTITPRGQSLGTTFRRQRDDSQFQMTRLELLSNLDVCMGGFVAEEMVYGADKATGGASSDFQRATQIATEMVLAYGMADSLGKLVLGTDSLRDLPESLQKRVNEEVREILGASYERTKVLLTKRRVEFEAITERLVEKETLSKEEIDDLLKYL